MVKTYLPCLLLLCAAPVFAKPTLTVYTYDSFAADWGPGPAVKKAFEAECDCELKFVALEDGVSLLNRLRMEGKNSAADVVLGLDNNLLQAARQTGLFAPSGVDTAKLTVPGGWQDATFVPYDYGYFAFVYNKEKLKNPPKSLQELVSSDRNWKVIYEDPRTSTPGLGLLLWMQKVYGDKAPAALAAAGEEDRHRHQRLERSLRPVPERRRRSGAQLHHLSRLSPDRREKDLYAAATFSEGHYLQVEVAGKLKAAKQPELAERFMQFMVTPAFQNTIPTGNWMYPVINTPLPIGFEQMNVPHTALQYSAEEVAKQRGGWIRAWQTAVSR